MAALIGILVDVSGSMHQNANVSRYRRGGGHVNEEGVKWSRSIFKVVEQVIKHDVSSGNKVFVIGYGAKNPPYIFDALNTVKNAAREYTSDTGDTRSKDQKIKDTLNILERNGAPFVRDWASWEKLYFKLTDKEVNMLSYLVATNHEFRRRFVSECLPKECRQRSEASVAKDVSSSPATYGVCAALPFFFGPVGIAVGVAAVAFTKESTRIKLDDETDKSIRKAVDKGVKLAKERLVLTSVTSSTVLCVKDASKILHGCIENEDHLTEQRIDTLMDSVEPFIYGGTPMIETLNVARDLFAKQDYAHHDKILFILSDGEPGDNGMIPDLASLNVKVMSCYVTQQNIPDPWCLYSTVKDEWDEGAKFMFERSSSVSTEKLPRTIFIHQGWTIEWKDNKTKLFAQVNHPDLVDDVCRLAREVIGSQDALSDILASVSLDLLINKSRKDFEAPDQDGETCYANACAAVMHLAMKRIVGREDGYPEFLDLRTKIIVKYGAHPADSIKVLRDMCPEYRLHCLDLEDNTNKAMKAIIAKRPVLAIFYLTKQEWKLFKEFYHQKPKGILSVKELNINRRPQEASTIGHAVVLTSFSSNGLRFMNSWGTDWGDNGFFCVRNNDVLKAEFVDVYWELEDLTESEKEAYKKEGPRIAEKFIKSLKGLRTSTFTCPYCDQASACSEFTGQLVRAKCPKCLGEFNPKDHEGYDLELTMYLTSLYREE